MITTKREKAGRPPGTKLPGLRETRHRFGVSANELALMSGVARHTIYKCEAGGGISLESVTLIRWAVVRLMREERA